MVRIFLAVTVVVAAALTAKASGAQLSSCPADIYAHAACDKFYKCAHGQETEHSCPSNLQFNPEIKICDYAWRVKCTGKDSGSACLSTPCQNGGVCTALSSGSYSCDCAFGFSGQNCQYSGSNACLSTPCQNGGVCTALSSGSYSCDCAFGFSGQNCQYGGSSNTGCFPVNPCQNAGQCTATADGSYTCQCVGGYHGYRCEVSPERPCSDTLDCLNGGDCPPPHYQRQYRCWCNGGYQGTRCELDPSAQLCPSFSPCQNGGNCFMVAGNTVCSCIRGYTGQRCEIPPPTSPCYPRNPCQNGGTCSITGPASFTCRCPPGYSGLLCQVPPSTPCYPNPCQNGGVCSPANGGYACQCYNGYTGTQCQVPAYNPCSSSPCKNGGVCSLTANGGYRCQCYNGYTGQNCLMPPAPTSPCYPSNPCQNGGTCSVIPGGYTCQCYSGYTGPTCRVPPSPTTPCRPSNPCQNGGTCSLTNNNGYICRCNSGYTGTNCQTPEQNNPCVPANPCQNGGVCTKVSSTSFSCRCLHGYSGSSCEITACSSLPCGTGTCYPDPTLQPAGYVCHCPGAPTPGGTSCPNTAPNVCNPNPCQNGAMCAITASGYTCGCKPGFSGRHCESVMCSFGANPCENGGTCLANFNQSPGYSCTCPNGFSGINCQMPTTGNNPCQPNPCQRGVCQPKGNDFTCVCSLGFMGKLCDRFDACSQLSNLCNTGKCIPQDNALVPFKCDCTGSGYTGTYCENVANACANNPCANGGVCKTSSSGTVMCDCPRGYYGLRCQNVGIERCSSTYNPCMNEGICVDTTSGVSCNCRQGYTGPRCENGGNACASTPCLNNGVCSNQGTGFKCACQKGFFGLNCGEVGVRSCATNVCQNFGDCYLTDANNLKCSCLPNYSGSKCEIVGNSPCASTPCNNGGECYSTNSGGQIGFGCTCKPGFKGTTCEQVTSDGACAENQAFPCPADVIYFTYPDYDNPDCNTFYVCQRGTLTRRQCAAGKKYNSATLKCEVEDGSRRKFFCDRVKQAFNSLKTSLN